MKNYEGDFYIERDLWYSTSGNEIKNPLFQLNRSESLMRRLIQDYGLNLSLESCLIFINPEFTLYQFPLKLPIIFPTQLNRYMKNLYMKSSKLNEKHTRFAEYLVSQHLNESSYTRSPEYRYDQLQKGITCASCSSLLTSLSEKKLVCGECGCKEDIESAILRSVHEFQVLFPERKITTNGIHEWVKVIESKKTIRRILRRNFKLLGHAQKSHYIYS